MSESLDFAEAAKRIRALAGLSQRDAAQKLRVTSVHLCNVEHAKTQPSIKLCRMYEDVFGRDLYVFAWSLFRKHKP